MEHTPNSHAQRAGPRALLLAAVVLMGAMTGAEAHDSEGVARGRLWDSATICTDGTVVQNHGYHWIETVSWGVGRVCDRPAATWHTQYQQYYKVAQWGEPGTYCGSRGWYEDYGDNVDMISVYDWDIWHLPCNNGPWVNVIISIDSWQYSWLDSEGWRGGAWRPATAHCHCP